MGAGGGGEGAISFYLEKIIANQSCPRGNSRILSYDQQTHPEALSNGKMVRRAVLNLPFNT